MTKANDMLVTLSVAQLEELVARAVTRGVVAAQPEPVEYLTLDQVAQMLNFCTRTVLSFVRNKGLPASKLENEWRFARVDVVLWMRERHWKVSNQVRKAG